MRIETILALLMAVAFFLPWLSTGGLGPSPSGYTLLEGTLQLQDQAGGYASFTDFEGGWVVYLFWAIPVGIVLTFVTGLLGAGSRLFAVIAGLAPLVLLGLGLREAGSNAGELFRFFEIGLWATLVLALLMLLAGIGLLRFGSR